MYTLWLIILNIFKISWRSLNFIRKIILNLFFFTILLIILGTYLKFYHFSPPLTKGALIVDLTGIIVDKPIIHNKFQKISRELFNIPTNKLRENSLFELVDILRQAKNDNNITGLVLSLKNFVGADQESLQYIGKVLHEFRDSGKPIYSIGDNYSQAQYFLASYANKIYLNSQGAVNIHGISNNKFYYKSLLDTLKIKTHIFCVGTYKSAIEPFSRNNMSDAAREADSRWVKQLWKQYLYTVANNRQITPQQLFPGIQKILADMYAVNGDAAKFALNNKLVDVILSRSAIEKEMIKIFGWNQQSNSFNSISIYNYPKMRSKLYNNNKISVIFINGVIINGQETPGSVSSDSIVNQIRNSYLDQNVKAIILRINSPGGSVTASELIRSELVTAARNYGKPVIVSMGGVAASGGYWIATSANSIIANTNTLTGSIGIFGMINTIESSLESIGIYTDGITTSPLAEVSLTKALPDAFSEMMQLSVENGYNNFVTLVANSRQKTLKEVDDIAQGRVWIGSDALQKGLIDILGDFDDAVNKAIELANLKNYQITWNINSPNLVNILFTPKEYTLYYKKFLNYIQSWSLYFINNQTIKLLSHDAHIALLTNNDPKNLYVFCSSCKYIY